MTGPLEDRLKAAAENRVQLQVDPLRLRARAQQRQRKRRAIFAVTLVVAIGLGFAGLRAAALDSPISTAVSTNPEDLTEAETGPSVHGSPVFNLGASVLAYLDIRAREEAATRVCMNDKGFAYEPEIADLWVVSDEIGGAYVTEMDDAEFANAFGFALSIGNGGDFIELNPDRATELAAAALAAESQALDQAVADLDEAPPDDLRPIDASEDSDYEAALYGYTFLGAIGLDDGCSGEAASIRESWNDRWEPEMIEAVDAAKRSLATDPELIAYYQPWSQCMAAEGHQATSPLAIQLEFQERFIALWSGLPTEDTQQDLTNEEQQLAVSTVSCGESVTQLLATELWPLWQRHGGHFPA